MSRVAKKPIPLAKGVEFNVTAEQLTVKGPKGTLSMARPAGVEAKVEDGHLLLSAEGDRVAMAGTTRAILANMVTGVSTGFERKLELDAQAWRDLETRAYPRAWRDPPARERVRPRDASCGLAREHAHGDAGARKQRNGTRTDPKRTHLRNEKRPDQGCRSRIHLDGGVVRRERETERERGELAASSHFAHDAGSERNLVDRSADAVHPEPKAPALWGGRWTEW